MVHKICFEDKPQNKAFFDEKGQPTLETHTHVSLFPLANT
jgi:hypothetical protein